MFPLGLTTKTILNHSTKEILKLLGAKGVPGAKKNEIQNYRRLFGFTDRDKDGKHSKTEYVDNGRYLTPESRAGIFNASDSNKDGFVSEKEYIATQMKMVPAASHEAVGCVTFWRSGCIHAPASFVTGVACCVCMLRAACVL